MNVKLAVLLLSVVAAVSADFWVVTFFSDDKCSDAAVSGGYIEVQSNCSSSIPTCTQAGNFWAKDQCLTAQSLVVKDQYTGVIGYTDNKCQNSNVLMAVKNTDTCYNVGTVSFSLSACGSKGDIVVKSGTNCTDMKVQGTVGSTCTTIETDYLTAFCKKSDASSVVVGSLALLFAIFALF